MTVQLVTVSLRLVREIYRSLLVKADSTSASKRDVSGRVAVQSILDFSLDPRPVSGLVAVRNVRSIAGEEKVDAARP